MEATSVRLWGLLQAGDAKEAQACRWLAGLASRGALYTEQGCGILWHLICSCTNRRYLLFFDYSQAHAEPILARRQIGM